MNKPSNLKDLMIGGHIGRSEIDAIARTLFDGKTAAAGPEGYIITAVAYDDLPKHVRDFILKAILEFSVENILDANELADEPDLGSPDPFDIENYEGH